jgi:hypothetical protein
VGSIRFDVSRGEIQRRRKDWRKPNSSGSRAELMPSTRCAYPQVISLYFAYFRVADFRISAVQPDFCAAEMRPFRLKGSIASTLAPDGRSLTHGEQYFGRTVG